MDPMLNFWIIVAERENAAKEKTAQVKKALGKK